MRLTPESCDTEPDVDIPETSMNNSGASVAPVGLLKLPVELLNLILSDFATIPEDDIIRNLKKFSIDCRERERVFRALSQVSRAYRTAFLPSFWKHLDLCTNANTKTWFADITKRNLKRCKGVAKTPRLGKLVKCGVELGMRRSMTLT